MRASFDRAHAEALDQADPLSRFRGEFHLPQHDGEDCIYLTGNSLGLQPRAAAAAVATELEDWARYGVEGHFQARHPWVSYHERFAEGLCHLTGAKAEEVVAMNALTVNLHLLLVSFYRPAGKRRKILCEARAFPSDRYALVSQIRFHKNDPDADLMRLWETEVLAVGRHLDPKVVESVPGASTDMANVSLVVPTIHPMLDIDAGGAVNHQPEFAAAAVGAGADRAVRDGALTMARTAIAITEDPALRQRLLTVGRRTP